jgi:formate hydrogenlyase subunit 4
MEAGDPAMSAASLLSPVCAIVLAPLLLGIVNRVKALFAGRCGQPLLQPYFDIARLLRKGVVYSTSSTWIFRVGAPLALGATLAAACMLPLGRVGAPLGFTGDLILFVYLLAVARFLTVISALDTASSFEGMGASREVFFSALAEPVLLVGLMALARSTHDPSLGGTLAAAAPFSVVTAALVGAGLFAVLLAENARIPFDDPNTHLELTMIHEVMVLDHSGPDFGIISYGAALKLWLFATIVARVALPWRVQSVWLDAALTLGAVFVVAILVGIVESTMARLRLRRVPQLLIAAGALTLLGLFFGRGL